jgi:hypothetical protein
MAKAISNTSPLLYLHRIDRLTWLSHLFEELWAPQAVVQELRAGKMRGYDVPELDHHPWIEIVDPRTMPSEWLALDLGTGELGAMALALENPDRILLLDDALARRTAEAAGLEVWGTLRLLLEAKSSGLIPEVGIYLNVLHDAGLWFSHEIQKRILALASE